MLANLAGFDEKERLAADKMPELERLMLARLAELDKEVRDGYAVFDFNRVAATLFAFCTNELSAFYFDIRKDVLYCDGATAPRRRAARTAMDEIFRRIVTWFAPLLCFTMEEAWLSRFPGEEESVHLQDFLPVPKEWANSVLIEKWKRVRDLRRVVTGALEIVRAEKKIGSSLEAMPFIILENEADAEILASIPFEEIAITSGVEIEALSAGVASDFALSDVPGVKVRFEAARGGKCERCWRVLPEVNGRQSHICDRCTDAVAGLVPA
jgi:isoleucyl-tRNA synthetase